MGDQELSLGGECLDLTDANKHRYKQISQYLKYLGLAILFIVALSSGALGWNQVDEFTFYSLLATPFIILGIAYYIEYKSK